ncbi:guanylate cyclase [Elysia marginata]|uniref:Guanylate cyclase n=1 Tax=Elysia marginata TaxID=1093978 RepID=A0AAV4J433_9GAST|nr:guanylate cyclase [Elysia marginata]
MGGEMLKEKEGWVAVAVKTLKVRHTMEEKLDFFSEVEMMKLFKHRNIVQLWGVCTRKQPMYAVMEFLLHGDLKTYLLSRRCLVGQGVKEAEDIKAENLTQMAVDVAQGLSYLHSLKYIHRDLACRNCLVHANKTVKIADFGLTRHVSSTDYYRFSRKGMLPVRWTSPEALRDGIYSFKSDIWSYGVLVFEIITFGSFPYQGLSNRQVVDEVVKGTPLKLPLQCNDALRSFIRWCMSVDPGYRPDLSDILSYFAYSPAFLTPCIDAPITSVVHEDTDSMGEDAKVPHVASKLPIIVSSSTVLHPAVSNAVSSMPNSSSTSTSSALHQPHRIHETAASSSIENHSGRRSLTRLKLHSTEASGEDGYRGVSWFGGRLKDKKKTFSVPGLFFSLGKQSKSVAAQQRGMTDSPKVNIAIPVSQSRTSSPSSEILYTPNICGLNACVRGNKHKTSAVRRRHSVGSDNYKSNDYLQNDRNGNTNSINFDISSSDRDENMEGSSDDGLFVRGWPQSSSAPESIVCDADVEIHCLNKKMCFISDIQNAAVRQFASSPNAAVFFEKGEVNSSGYISENSKGDMKHICQTVTSL